MRALSVPLLAAIAPFLAGDVFAHGIVGKRFFPATLTIDDPFVADELSLPTYSNQKYVGSPEEPAMSQSSYAYDNPTRIPPISVSDLAARFSSSDPKVPARPPDGTTTR